MMINNQLDFLFDHTLTSLRTAAVAQWVRAFVGDGGGYICLCKMCDMLVFHMMKTLQICGLYVDVFFSSGNTNCNQKRFSNHKDK